MFEPPVVEVADTGVLADRLDASVDQARRHEVEQWLLVAAWADPRAFSQGHWRADAPPSLHYIAGGAFFENGPAFQVR